MKEYVVVTGANGYLGSYVCRELIKQGYQIIAFKYLHFASTIIKNEAITYVDCDISKPILTQEPVKHLLRNKKVNTIINLAALLGSSDYEKNYAVNAMGVKNLIDFANELGAKRFIQISSVVVLKPFKGPYGETKLKGQEFLKQSGLDYTIFIPAMILGPEGLGINRILKNVFRFPLIVPLVGNGSQTQHPIFIKDLACYIVKSISEQKCYKKEYQIAGDQIISFKEFISLILKIKGKRKTYIPIPPYIVKILGHIFQKVQRVPLFTAEHVKGILQDSKLDTKSIEKDLDLKPTPLQDALKISLNKIGGNWNYYLQERPENIITID